MRYDILAGGGLLLFVLGLVLVMTLRSDPEELTASPQVSDSGQERGDVQLELSKVTDLVDRVELTWQSTKELDFAVIVAKEGEPEPDTKLAHRRTSMTIAVEPGRKYCFAVQGTDSVETYESEPVPLRGATCSK